MSRGLRRVAHLVAVGLAAILVVTCTDTSTAPRGIAPPSFEIVDGTQPGGNADVFFLPPLASTPSGGTYGFRPANPNLKPFATVCTRDVSQPSGCLDNNPANVTSLAMMYDPTGQFYQVNWQTGQWSLTDGTIYRIQIFVGRISLALRDVLPQPSSRGGTCLTTDSLCTFNNGSNLPIKVRIQTKAVCIQLAIDAGETPDTSQTCATATLSSSDTLALSDLGTTSNLNTTATINMQPCHNDSTFDFRKQGLVDLPTFGHCVQINNVDSLPVIGTATLCQAVTEAEQAGVSPTAADRMTVHRNSGDTGDNAVYALPHGAGVGCSVAFGTRAAPQFGHMGELLKFARQTWHATTDRVGLWLQPAPLWAAPSAPPCHVGGCGGVGTFESYYQVVQPAWMDYDATNPTGDFGTHTVGDVVTAVIDLWDSGELDGSPEPPPAPEPVNNVRLHVQVNGATPTTILSGPPGGFANGVARFQFSVAPGANLVKVWGKGVGTKSDPNTFLHVFAPLMSTHSAADTVLLRADTLVFTATGRVPLVFVPDPPTGTIYTNASGIATFPNFQVCASPRTPGIAVTSLSAVTNNGTYKSLGSLPAMPVLTGSTGCYTFSGVTINGTGAFHLLANGVYSSQKFNVKPGK
jgi:hypothetical protein